ncbi:retinol dehydrogenase 13-like [Sorex fumeus]|uniref:retinol dehydrogenase 13-like n=1 Tax=Sorex fumeus TaxID=62283 RepID=UPI0024AE1EEC|nr:retinol dehydrogenase 13-like [Sorex fumeus]
MGCWELNPGWPSARQTPAVLLIQSNSCRFLICNLDQGKGRDRVKLAVSPMCFQRNALIWGLAPVLTILVYGLSLGWRRLQKPPWGLHLCPTDLTGKTAVVTGANSGIGKAVAQELALRGACVILACRNPESGRRAQMEIQAATKGKGRLLLGDVDLSSMASVRSFASWLQREHPEIHLLVNNAAVCGLPTILTPEGFDVTFATNYIGPFLLTNLLQGLLQQAGTARVVNLSSFMHVHGYIDEDHMMGTGRPLGFNQNYYSTKLMLILFTRELAQRLQGTGVTVNSVDPGVVYTGIMKTFPWYYRVGFWLLSFFLKDIKQSAVPVLYLCLAKELDGISGRYFSNSCVITLPSEIALDRQVGQRLWQSTARLTNLDQTD